MWQGIVSCWKIWPQRPKILLPNDVMVHQKSWTMWHTSKYFPHEWYDQNGKRSGSKHRVLISKSEVTVWVKKHFTSGNIIYNKYSINTGYKRPSKPLVLCNRLQSFKWSRYGKLNQFDHRTFHISKVASQDLKKDRSTIEYFRWTHGHIAQWIEIQVFSKARWKYFTP